MIRPDAFDVAPVSPVYVVRSYHLPDEGSANFYSVDAKASFSVKDVMSLTVFTRGNPAFKSFVLQFIDPAAAQTAQSCNPLAPPAGLIASADVSFVTSQPEGRLTAAFVALKAAPTGTAQLNVLSFTSAVPDAIKQRVAAGKSTALVRVIPVGGDLNQCLVFPSGTLAASFYDPSKQAPVVFPVPPPPTPTITAGLTVASYSPVREATSMRCDFIVIGKVTDAKFSAIMDAAHASKALGTHFFLCPDVAESLYNGLPVSTKAGIAFSNLLSYFSGAFNWTAAKFQAAAAAIGTPILGKKYGTIFGEAMLGQLPGSPLTGDFNTLVDQGCEYVKAKADAKIKDDAKDSDASGVTKPADSAVQQVCDEVKKAFAAHDAVSDFLAHDPALDPHSATVMVTVRYYGDKGLPAGAVGGGGQQQVTIESTGFAGSNCQGNACGGPREPLYRGQFELPNMAAGSKLDVPVMLSVQPYASSSAFRNGFVDNQRANIRLDYTSRSPVLVYLRDPYPFPASLPPPTPY